MARVRILSIEEQREIVAALYVAAAYWQARADEGAAANQDYLDKSRGLRHIAEELSDSQEVHVEAS